MFFGYFFLFFYLEAAEWPSNAFLFGWIYPKNKKSSRKFATNILPKNLNKPPVRLKKHNRALVRHSGFWILDDLIVDYREYYANLILIWKMKHLK